MRATLVFCFRCLMLEDLSEVPRRDIFQARREISVLVSLQKYLVDGITNPDANCWLEKTKVRGKKIDPLEKKSPDKKSRRNKVPG